VQAVFSSARNGSPTCSVNGIHIHSAYNPETEAQRFVDTLTPRFNPSCVIVVEPALSYCAKPLRKRFPEAVLCAVRLLPDFRTSDPSWDHIFYYDISHGAAFFSEVLYHTLGEDLLCASFFCTWPPSQQAMNNLCAILWEAIKSAVLKSRDVLATRAKFTSRWTANAVLSATRMNSCMSVKAGSAPVIVAASGPSLQSSLAYILSRRSSFFLIAVSSALSPLLANGITPDICFTTDGGFWASYHLASPCIKQASYAVAASSESYCPPSLYSCKNIIPLSYEDGPECDIYHSCSIPYIHAERNGTVSGTAALFALSITTGPVYMCGLDLAPSAGFVHTQPNALDINNSLAEKRTFTRETRISSSRFSSDGSLGIYRSWFRSVSKQTASRLFRLSDNFSFTEKLSPIADINWNFFSSNLSSVSQKNMHLPLLEKCSPLLSCKERTEIVSQLLSEKRKSGAWNNLLCPLEHLIEQRSLNSDAYQTEHQKYIESCDSVFRRLEKTVSGGRGI
jgi:hypothetical protein